MSVGKLARSAKSKHADEIREHKNKRRHHSRASLDEWSVYMTIQKCRHNNHRPFYWPEKSSIMFDPCCRSMQIDYTTFHFQSVLWVSCKYEQLLIPEMTICLSGLKSRAADTVLKMFTEVLSATRISLSWAPKSLARLPPILCGKEIHLCMFQLFIKSVPHCCSMTYKPEEEERQCRKLWGAW